MNQVHVMPHSDDQWKVVTDENDTPLHITSTQADATDFARTFAQDNGMELAVHGEDGVIRKKDSSGEGVDDENAADHT